MRTSSQFGEDKNNHQFVLFLPNLLASCGAVIMLGASYTGGIMPFKDNAASAAAMLGSFEFMGGGIVGSIIMHLSHTSVLPLAIFLMMIGVCITICRMYLKA